MNAYYPRFKNSDHEAWEVWNALVNSQKDEADYLIDGVINDVECMSDSLTRRGKDLAQDISSKWQSGEVLTLKQVETMIAILHCGWYKNNFADLGKPSNLYIVWDGNNPSPFNGVLYFHCKIGRSENPDKRLKAFRTTLPNAKLLYKHHIHSRMEKMVQDKITEFSKGEYGYIFKQDSREWYWVHYAGVVLTDSQAWLHTRASSLFDTIIDRIYEKVVDDISSETRDRGAKI